jgi:hypothetical protein
VPGIQTRPRLRPLIRSPFRDSKEFTNVNPFAVSGSSSLTSLAGPINGLARELDEGAAQSARERGDLVPREGKPLDSSDLLPLEVAGVVA